MGQTILSIEIRRMQKALVYEAGKIQVILKRLSV